MAYLLATEKAIKHISYINIPEDMGKNAKLVERSVPRCPRVTADLIACKIMILT